jgi:hypothetical protein
MRLVYPTAKLIQFYILYINNSITLITLYTYRLSYFASYVSGIMCPTILTIIN